MRTIGRDSSRPVPVPGPVPLRVTSPGCLHGSRDVPPIPKERGQMNSMEASELLRTRRALTGSTFNDDTITAWQQALGGQDYQQCHAALISAARDEKRVTVAHIWERLPLPTREATAIEAPPLCIRCHTETALHLHTRCAYCQTIVDEQAAIGYTDTPGMASAIAAAHSMRTPPL